MATPVEIEESVTIRGPRTSSGQPCPTTPATVCHVPGSRNGPQTAGSTPLSAPSREVLHKGGRDYVTESTVTENGPGVWFWFSGSGTTGKVEGGRSVVAGAYSDSEAVFTYQVTLTLSGATRLPAADRSSSLRKGLREDLGRLRDKLESGRAWRDGIVGEGPSEVRQERARPTLSCLGASSHACSHCTPRSAHRARGGAAR